MPAPHLEAIGLKSKGRRVYELAAGKESAVDITTADIEFMGETVGGTILFGAANAEPLLGVTALESVGIEVDPLDQRLKRLPAVRLKGIPPKATRTPRVKERQRRSYDAERCTADDTTSGKAQFA